MAGLERVAGLLDQQAAALHRLRAGPEDLARGAQVRPGVVALALVEQPLRVGEVGLAQRVVVVGELVQRERAVGEPDRLVERAGRGVRARDRVLGGGARGEVDRLVAALERVGERARPSGRTRPASAYASLSHSE